MVDLQEETLSNPLGVLSSKFDNRLSNRRDGDRGGTLGNINWFQGEASDFHGLKYQINPKTTISAEYSSDLMSRESGYLDIESPISVGLSYQLNDYIYLSSQYLHGSLFSFTASLRANPGRPPLLGGKELAPIPMRLRSDEAPTVEKNDENLIRKVLSADQFDIHSIDFKENHVSIAVTNTKFRSTAQAVGRVASTLQRFSSDAITSANISFIYGGMQTANYYIDLEKVTEEQFSTVGNENTNSSIFAINADTLQLSEENQRFSWGV